MTTYYLELYEFSENADIKQISTKNLEEYLKDFRIELDRRNEIKNTEMIKKDFCDFGIKNGMSDLEISQKTLNIISNFVKHDRKK